MKKLTYLFILLFTSITVSAEVAIIVHPTNTNNLDNSAISRIFLGKTKTLPEIGAVTVVYLPEGTSETEEFNQKVLSKSASQLKAYWSKLVFTGKGSPPQVLSSDSEVLKMVAENPNIVGYIDASKVNDSVKVVTKF